VKYYANTRTDISCNQNEAFIDDFAEPFTEPTKKNFPLLELSFFYEKTFFFFSNV